MASSGMRAMVRGKVLDPDDIRQPKPSDAKIISTTPLPPGEAKWTRLSRITYQAPDGRQRTWESAERTTRPQASQIDGVGIVAILERDTGPEILLQKQFRPPAGKVCIEVPAGLVDENETPEEAALRELREETGYVGTISSKGRGCGLMFNDPGFTNTNVVMVHVKIDMSLEENRSENLKPQLEENEFIEVFSVKLSKLWSECKKLEGEGYAIDARVGTMAEGLELARVWKVDGQ